MKKTFLLLCMLVIHPLLRSQQLTDGPEIENIGNDNVSGILEGDSACFFVYRQNEDIRTSYIIEKYDKATLKKIYSEQMHIQKAEAILTVGSKVYLFYSSFSQSQNSMSVFFQELSPEGKLLPDVGEVVSVQTDNPKFAQFDITQTPDKSGFLVKVSYKSTKEDTYRTDFILLDSRSFKKIYTKSVAQKFFSDRTAFENFTGLFYKDLQFIGFTVTNEGAIYYGYSYTAINETGSSDHSVLSMVTIPPTSTEAQMVTIALAPEGDLAYTDSRFTNIKFTINNAGQLLVCGFFRAVEKRQGHDRASNGIFGYTINAAGNSITASKVKEFDDGILDQLNTKKSNANDLVYRADYLFTSGKSSYLVGEQCLVRRHTTGSSTMGYMGASTTISQEYMDVIVAKYNPEGEFEWIKNTPMHSTIADSGPYLQKQYAAFSTANNIYILTNENPFNTKSYPKPKLNLLSHSMISGTNCVYTSVAFTDGKIDHKLLFPNKTFLFTPAYNRKKPRFYKLYLSPFGINNTVLAESEDMILQSGNDVLLFTHKKEKDRFSKVTF